MGDLFHLSNYSFNRGFQSPSFALSCLSSFSSALGKVLDEHMSTKKGDVTC
jgi:hypothetical protein